MLEKNQEKERMRKLLGGGCLAYEEGSKPKDKVEEREDES